MDSDAVLRCPVCLIVFTPNRRPLSQPCGHTVCGECAPQLNGTCPECRADLPVTGTTKPSVALMAAIEQISELRKHARGISIICTDGNCAGCSISKPAIVCTRCLETFCDRCDQSEHVSVRQQTHTRYPIALFKSSVCKLHLQLGTHYCAQLSQVLCPVCMEQPLASGVEHNGTIEEYADTLSAQLYERAVDLERRAWCIGFDSETFADTTLQRSHALLERFDMLGKLVEKFKRIMVDDIDAFIDATNASQAAVADGMRSLCREIDAILSSDTLDITQFQLGNHLLERAITITSSVVPPKFTTFKRQLMVDVADAISRLRIDIAPTSYSQKRLDPEDMYIQFGVPSLRRISLGATAPKLRCDSNVFSMVPRDGVTARLLFRVIVAGRFTIRIWAGSKLTRWPVRDSAIAREREYCTGEVVSLSMFYDDRTPTFIQKSSDPSNNSTFQFGGGREPVILFQLQLLFPDDAVCEIELLRVCDLSDEERALIT